MTADKEIQKLEKRILTHKANEERNLPGNEQEAKLMENGEEQESSTKEDEEASNSSGGDSDESQGYVEVRHKRARVSLEHDRRNYSNKDVQNKGSSLMQRKKVIIGTKEDNGRSSSLQSGTKYTWRYIGKLNAKTKAEDITNYL